MQVHNATFIFCIVNYIYLYNIYCIRNLQVKPSKAMLEVVVWRSDSIVERERGRVHGLRWQLCIGCNRVDWAAVTETQRWLRVQVANPLTHLLQVANLRTHLRYPFIWSIGWFAWSLLAPLTVSLGVDHHIW